MKLFTRVVVLVLASAAVASCAPHGPPVMLGSVRWRWRPPAPASMGMPAADQTSVAATYGHLRLVLFSASGAVQWQAERLGFREVCSVGVYEWGPS